MLNSVALQVVIGLIFIYLLYSLLATILSEMIATLLGLRARNLYMAIDRMLNDEKVQTKLLRFLISLKIRKPPESEVTKAFYNNPEIKQLGGAGLFRKPSFISAASFSKTLIDELSGNGPVTANKISSVYLLSVWKEASGDIQKFRRLSEDWFNRTMEQASEWYKRKIQFVLLVIGFCIAWFFCADTFTIVHKLSVDKDAREKMVLLADTYVKENPTAGDTALVEVKKKLAADMAGANTVLGLGGWLPDRVSVVWDPETKGKTYTPELDPDCLSSTFLKISNGKIVFTFGDKMAYLFRLAWHHFFGFLITAVAISLGAPFWFDLLNKMMRLRTAIKEKPEKM